MGAWVLQRRAEPAGVEVASLDGLELWIADRQQASSKTSSQKKTWTW